MKKILFVKTHPDAKTPTKKYEGDVGYDLYTLRDTLVTKNKVVIVPTGIRIALPKGCYAEIHPRSSYELKLTKSRIGIVDEGFRGDIGIMTQSLASSILVRKGERIAQLIIKKRVKAEFVATDFLPISKRGTKGFGSSGK